MGTGSSSGVEPFHERHDQFNSGYRSRFSSEGEQYPEDHPFGNKFQSNGIDGEGEEYAEFFGAKGSQIDHPRIHRHQEEEITPAAYKHPSGGRRKDSERNPFEIETEAEYPLSITDSSTRERGLGRGSVKNHQSSRTWSDRRESGTAQRMAWNQRQASDVAGLSNSGTKKISRSRLSYEDSCDEGLVRENIRSDPKILTDETLTEIDHLLYSEVVNKDRAEAFLVNLDNKKRGQSVSNSIEPRHVSIPFFAVYPLLSPASFLPLDYRDFEFL
jgi:hypothetical protein